MDKKRKMTILVTGAAGFIGSKLASVFEGGGHSVIRTDVVEGIAAKCELLDLSDSRALISRFSGGTFDLVIHCASQQPRKHCVTRDYDRGNATLLNNVLDLMKKTGVKKVITFSSATVFVNSTGDLLDEDSDADPSNDYAKSKLAGEELLKNRTAEENLVSVCFRLPSVFGAEQDGGLISTYCNLAKSGKDFEVFSNGLLLRSLLHVDEIVQATVKAVEKINEMDGFNLFLLGSSNTLTMGEVADYIIEKVGSSSKAMPVDTPAPINVHWNLSIDKARQQLGFEPVTIERGIDRYIDEMKEAGR